jgi:hypothetical protein
MHLAAYCHAIPSYPKGLLSAASLSYPKGRLHAPERRQQARHTPRAGFTLLNEGNKPVILSERSEPKDLVVDCIITARSVASLRSAQTALGITHRHSLQLISEVTTNYTYYAHIRKDNLFIALTIQDIPFDAKSKKISHYHHRCEFRRAYGRQQAK